MKRSLVTIPKKTKSGLHSAIIHTAGVAPIAITSVAWDLKQLSSISRIAEGDQGAEVVLSFYDKEEMHCWLRFEDVAAIEAELDQTASAPPKSKGKSARKTTTKRFLPNALALMALFAATVFLLNASQALLPFIFGMHVTWVLLTVKLLWHMLWGLYLMRSCGIDASRSLLQTK